MNVRFVKPEDHEEWLRMRCALWPEGSREEHASELDDWLAAGNAVFVSPREEGGLQGFVEVSIRNYAEGCETNHVGYVEGWYVDEDRRKQGVGRTLIAAAEDWARAQGCTEMASDALLTNTISHQAHERLGYIEQERIVCFKKML
ncbi:MAG TPA: aminoglycoside 6'-N-acetyltransferase [Blastocatellia bacterium]|nr:aminoglycoside 6'-N-acetyltransferase [Blastocatellia bacterium]